MTFAEATAAGNEQPADLVRRILAGEPSAEEELVCRYTRGVTIIVRRIVKDPSVTEDLCQETFRLVLEKVRRGDLREAERLSGFVCSLARNLAIDYFRQAARRETLEDMEATRPLPDPAPDQLSLLLQKEKAKAIRQVLKELKSERDREVLYRFYIAEEEKDQICADLGLSSLHFNRVLYRARERFRELCEQTIKK
ncbi:MAG TPA: sigma-70 family RNA polymerase sigma factor [Terriglobales bacterium]|jgi:RNA polymerase sigma-70 factor (ECF subfamily)|nr:sigma-70 family RNA polymerase sigma factor [Terriglobales bacterium]